ncbi:hypothetical protein DFJ77DRAFT_219984 [Powellomyces hirtus]|nr:hypothetical protein DFJ77DRAFT_219984 [Powellomyces hirtus]
MSVSPPRADTSRPASASPRSTARRAPRRRPALATTTATSTPSTPKDNDAGSGNDSATLPIAVGPGSGRRKRDSRDTRSATSGRSDRDDHSSRGRGDHTSNQSQHQHHHQQQNASSPYQPQDTRLQQRIGAPVILERRAPQGPAGPGGQKSGIVPTGLLLRKPPTETVPSVDVTGTPRIQQRGDRGHSLPAWATATPLPAAPVSPYTAYRILDQHQRFQPSEYVHKALSDLPGSFVVGVLGTKRVGKSVILSHLATNTSVFSPGLATAGINLHVTPERIVLLDTQPLQLQASASPRTEMVHSIRLATFVMTVCHTVIIVGTTPLTADQEMITFLRRIETIRHRLFPIPKDDLRERCPSLIYVANKCSGKAFTIDAYHLVAQDFITCFKNTRLRTSGSTVGIELAFPYYRRARDQDGEEDQNLRATTIPSVFLLPRCPALVAAATKTADTVTHPAVPTAAAIGPPYRPPIMDRLIDFGVPARFEIMLKLLRNQIFETPRFPTPDSMHRRVWYGQSERDWLKSAARSWEVVRKADVAGEWIRAGKS